MAILELSDKLSLIPTYANLSEQVTLYTCHRPLLTFKSPCAEFSHSIEFCTKFLVKNGIFPWSVFIDKSNESDIRF